MPITILIIEKLGNIKEHTLKTYNESELYKKAGYKSADGFQCHAQWNVEELNGKSYSISVFGKTTGRANQENKYEFPPPIDNTLFFGSCVIVNKTDDGSAASLCESEWNSIYEYLYGGFEDIGDEDEEEDDVDVDDELPKTKSGYAKDGFVVDDDELEEEDEDEEDEDEDYEDDEEDEDEPRKTKSKSKSKTKPKSKPIKKTTKKTSVVLENVFAKITKSVAKEATPDDNYLECTSELSEESYV
jgi:hypothetical protein